MTICLKTSSAGSASAGFSDMHAETARMSGITNRVLRSVPDAEARKPIRGRHNLRYAIEKPWVETRGFILAVGWVAGWVRCRGIGGFLLPWQDKSYVPFNLLTYAIGVDKKEFPQALFHDIISAKCPVSCRLTKA